jgi:hypothetical protein
MPTEELESLISGYKINQAPLTEDLPSFSAAPGVSIADYQKIVDSGKSWFSEDLTSDYGGKDAVYFRTPEQIELEQEFYQNNWEKAGAGVLRTVNKFASEILKMPGYIGGLTQAAITDATLGESLDNWWVNGIQDWENYANEELLKVYVPDSVRYGSLWDNLSSASFYATEGADGVGFLTSMLVPGNALKLLKLGQRGVNLYNAGNAFLRSSRGMAKGLTKTQSLRYAAQADKLGTRAARNFDDFTAATVNATLEASAEAKESFENTLNTVISNYMESNRLEDPSQIDNNTMMSLREQAGEVAASVFKFNMAILMVPNLMDQKALFGAFGSRKSGLGKLFNEQGVLQDFSAKTLKQKSLGYLGALGKGVLKEGFFEEGMQFTGAEYFKDQAALPEDEQDKTYYQNIGGLVDSYVKNLGSTDMQKAIALGGILGGGMSVIGQVKDDKYQTKYGSLLHAQLKNNLIDRMKGVADVFEKDDTGKIKFEQGKPVINQEKFKDLLAQPENKIMLNKLADIAALSGDKEDYNLIQSILDYNYFQPFFEQGQEGIQILKNHITGELSKSESEKQDVEELLGLTGSKDATERMSSLLQRVDDYYQLYDSVNNRHEFDMPSLEGGKRSDKAEFSQLIRNKKLEKVLLNSELKKVTTSLNQQVFSIVSKNLVNQEDPTTPGQLSESDKKELELLYGKEAQYKKQLDDLLEDEKALYSKEAIQEEYAKFLANKEKKELEKKEADATDEQIKDKFAKDLANAGYVMDREHSLDPDKKSKLSPEELEKFKGQDKSFYFELNGKEYEAYSTPDPKTGKYKRVYRDAETKKVIGEFTIDFLKKNKNIRIINKQEAADRRKLEKIRKNKTAKLRAFDVIYKSMLQNFTNNKNAIEGLYSKRVALKEEIELYKNWIKEITNEYGRANNGKAQEKKALLDEIKRVEGLIAGIDLEIADNNAIYESLERQYNLLLAIKEDFEIYKENGVFKTEQPSIELSEFANRIKEQINQELEQLIKEEEQVNEMLNTAREAVTVAEQSLNEALDLKIELEIIFEDLTRIRDINDIIRLLVTSDFTQDANPRYNESGRALPSALALLADRYKPLRLIYEAVDKLRNNTITDEEYIRLINIANNLLTETYLGYGNQGLTQIKNEIAKAAAQATKFPISAQIEFRLNEFNFVPNRIIANILDSRTRLLDAANKMLEQVTGDKKAISDKIEPIAKQLGVRDSELNSLMTDLFVQYKRFFNIGNTTNPSFNNEAPINQQPTVYDNPENKINPASFLANFIFRSIGLDINYDEKTGKTSYVNGLPELNEKDENFRRLQKFIDENPDLANKYNVRFFIARTDAEGNTSVNLGADQSNAELLGLYNAIGMPAGDLSIGFYLEDKEGKFATQVYKGSDKMVMGWIPQSITDANGRLRINNATAVSIVTGFDIKRDKVKMINKYDMSEKDGVYTFNGTNNKKESNVTVTIADGKAVIKSRFDVLSQDLEALTIPDDKAQEIALLLKENSAYSLSRAGKEIYTLLKQSKTKYHNYVELTREKTDFVESASVFDSYGEVTLDNLIAKSKEALAGPKGLYQTSVINKLVEHIETNNKKAFVGIQQVTGGIPLREYEVDPTNPDTKTNTLFNKPIENKVTKAFPVKFEKGVLQGATVEVVDFTNTVTLGHQPGTVVLRLKNSKGNYTGEVVPLNQRTLNSNEILTALFIMSTADEANAQTPAFGKLPDGKLKYMRTSKAPKGFTKYGMLPFNKTSNVSAITSLLYWGKHNDNFYTDVQGNKIPMTTNKVGEIFYHEGQIYFKRKTSDGKWVDASVNINALKQALSSSNPLQDPIISDLVSFLADKRINVNKELLDNDGGSLYFHPTVTKTATGYEFTFQSFDSYQEFLLSGSGKFKEALTTNVPTKENFPKFANKMIVFKSTGRIVPFIKEEFVEPKEEAPAPTKRKATKVKTSAKATASKQAKEASDDELSKKFKEKQKEKRKSGQKERLKAKLLALEAEDESQEEETSNEIATGTGGLMKGGKIEFKKKAPAETPTTNARTVAENKALEILNKYAERSDNEIEYQGDEFEGRTSEDEEGPSTTTLSKITNAIKSLPPVPYDLTSKSIEEFKEKLKNELLDGGLDDMVDEVLSNIDKLVDEQLAASQPTTTTTNPFGKGKTGLGVGATSKVNKMKNDQDINCP